MRKITTTYYAGLGFSDAMAAYDEIIAKADGIKSGEVRELDFIKAQKLENGLNGDDARSLLRISQDPTEAALLYVDMQYGEKARKDIKATLHNREYMRDYMREYRARKATA